jgi:putative membrane protein
VRKRITIVVGVVVLMLAPGISAYAAPPPSAQDIGFLRAAHQGNLTEIAAGKNAQFEAANEDLRKLGARFVRDHTALDATVTATAARLHVTLPNKPTPSQRALLSRYRAAAPTEFDALFVTTQLQGLQKAKATCRTELTKGSAESAKQVAAKAERVIAAHHKALLAISRDLG